MSTFYVEFQAPDSSRLEELERVVEALARAKESGEWRDDEYWLGFFDEAARRHFWRPTESERRDFRRRWSETPADKRLSDPTLQTPWDFGSMIDAFRNGDYRLVGLEAGGGPLARLVRGAPRARLVFEPFGHPYGGTECMVALVESFGFQVTKQSD